MSLTRLQLRLASTWAQFAKQAGNALFWHRAIFFMLAAFILSAGGMYVMSTFLRIAIDPQEQTCLPYRVFLVTNGLEGRPLQRGDIVAFKPGSLMGKNFEGVTVAKIVAGLPGDRIEVTRDDVLVNGESIGSLVPRLTGLEVRQRGLHPVTLEKMGRSAAELERSEVVPHNMIFAVATEERMFDGRYWGFLPVKMVMGRARPVV